MSIQRIARLDKIADKRIRDAIEAADKLLMREIRDVYLTRAESLLGAIDGTIVVSTTQEGATVVSWRETDRPSERFAR